MNFVRWIRSKRLGNRGDELPHSYIERKKRDRAHRSTDGRRGEPSTHRIHKLEAPWQIVARTHPLSFFFFLSLFSLSEARCPIFLATRQEFLALYALLFKGAREAHTPFFLGRRVALIEPLSHTRTSHESTT